MKEVKLRQLTGARDQLSKVIEINEWCREQGLEYEKDYTWQRNTSDSLKVCFETHCEEMATLFALTWVK